MEISMDGLTLAGEVLLDTALNPLYYLGLILIALLYRRQVTLERKLFYMRLHGVLGQFWRALLWGLVGALLISAATAGFGLLLNMDTLIWVWSVSMLLMLIRIRYANMAYAAGIIAGLQLVAQGIDMTSESELWLKLMNSLASIHLPSLFALTAILLVIEAVFMRMFVSRIATPLYVEGKRGKVIGAYELRGIWALPLFLVVPASSGVDTGFAELPWTMFFGAGEWSGGWSLLAFPVLMGYAEMTASELPAVKAKRIFGKLLLFALLIGTLAVLIELWPYAWLIAITAVLSIAVHEAIVIVSDRMERGRSPGFVDEGPGLKVLDVMPGSPAAAMEILRGESIVKANGYSVSTKEELHAALRTNSAFCKLEILNLDGHNRFEHRALFDGEHHQLGLVLCPDDQTVNVTVWRPLTLYRLIRVRIKKVRSSTSVTDQARAGEHEQSVEV